MELVNIASEHRLGVSSPLRYPGGKSKLAGFFADVIAEAGLHGATYVEPFAGGAGAGLALLHHGIVDRVVINDLDPAVFAFWSSVRNEPADFVRRINTVPLTLEEWAHQKLIYKTADARDPFALGFAFFYLNRTNRSGVLNAGVIGGKSQSGTYRIDARFNRDELARKVQDIGNVADQIELTFDDGRKCVQQWAPQQNTFLYVDPPYVEAGGSLYLNAFDDRDHALLARSLTENNAHRWLLTYDDAPLVRSLYASMDPFDFELHYSAHKVGRARELLVASDPLRHLLARRRTGQQ